MGTISEHHRFASWRADEFDHEVVIPWSCEPKIAQYQDNDHTRRLNQLLNAELRAKAAYQRFADEGLQENFAAHRHAIRVLVKLMMCNEGLRQAEWFLPVPLMSEALLRVAKVMPDRMQTKANLASFGGLETWFCSRYEQAAARAPLRDQGMLLRLFDEAARCRSRLQAHAAKLL